MKKFLILGEGMPGQFIYIVADDWIVDRRLNLYRDERVIASFPATYSIVERDFANEEDN